MDTGPRDALRQLGRKLDMLQLQIDEIRGKLHILRRHVDERGTMPVSLERIPSAAPPPGEATDRPRTERPPSEEGEGAVPVREDDAAKELAALANAPALPSTFGEVAEPPPLDPSVLEAVEGALGTPPDRELGEGTPEPAQAEMLDQVAVADTSAPPAEGIPERQESYAPGWESLVGANWLNRIGIVILLLAGAFLAHVAWQRQWIGPHAQVAAILIVGIALIGGGELFQRRKLPIFAQGLTALGIFALYAGGLVGYQLHHILSLQATFVVYALTTAGAFLIAARTNSVAVVLLGMLGGYLTPIVLSTGRDAPVALFTYLLFLNIAIAATAIAKRWEFLSPIAFVSTAIMFLRWYIKFYEPNELWMLETMLSLHAGLFLVVAIFPYVALGRPSSRISLWMLSKTSLAFFGVTYLLFRLVPDHHLGEFAALYGLGHWLLAGAVYAARRHGERLLVYLLGLGAVFVTVAVPIYFSGDHRAIAWSAQALVFTIIGIRYRSAKTLWSAVIVYGLAVWWTCVHDVFAQQARGEWGGIDIRFATTAMVSALLAGGGLGYRIGRERIRDLVWLSFPHVGFVFAAVADVLLVAAAVHQFPDHRLALAWTVNALAVCAAARWRRDDVAGAFGLLMFLPAFVRFVQFQALAAAPEEWIWGLDVRFAQGLFVVAGSWAAAYLVRRKDRWHDLPSRSVVAALAGNVVLLVASALQWDGWLLTSLWALDALGLAAFARWQGLSRLAWFSAGVFGWVTLWWLRFDVSAGAVVEWYPAIMASFASGLVLIASGWLAAWLFRGAAPKHFSSVVALSFNLVLLVAIGDQWDGHLVLTLWALDVAVLWMIGFARRHTGARAEALLLWIGVLGAWIVLHGLKWSPPLEAFGLLINPRFGSLALVGAIGLCATWAYRRFSHRLMKTRARAAHVSEDSLKARLVRHAQGFAERWGQYERSIHVVCVVLANLLLVGALTLEVNTLFDRYECHGGSPFDNLVMARQTTLSILWASYAAVLFIAGFVVLYVPIRILALIGLAPILVKVFLVDLRDLDVIYRVLSFAVLGVLFVGVSLLYQRFRSRLGLESREQSQYFRQASHRDP